MSWLERASHLIDRLSIRNALVLALVVAIAIPAVFMWRFLSDEKFRHEFISSVEVIDMKVPCIVARTRLPGDQYRYLIGSIYEIRGRMEYGIVVRSPGLLSDNEVVQACASVHEEVAKAHARK